MWYCYMLRCENGSLYTGVTTSLPARYAEHLKGTGSKAVKAAGGPTRFELTVPMPDQSAALKMEAALKRLSKASKEKIVAAQSVEGFTSLSKHLPPPATGIRALKPLQGT